MSFRLVIAGYVADNIEKGAMANSGIEIASEVFRGYLYLASTVLKPVDSPTVHG